MIGLGFASYEHLRLPKNKGMSYQRMIDLVRQETPAKVQSRNFNPWVVFLVLP